MNSDPREIAQRTMSAQEWFLANYENHGTFFKRKRDGRVFVLISELLSDYRDYALAAEMHRWVPAKEGSMPAYGACVMVYGHDVDDSQKLGYVDVSTYSLYSGWGINAGGRATDCAITHWQPLPSPPREEAK